MAQQRYRTPVAVDLFCGAGGLTHGFINEGIPVRAGFDLDPTCKYPFEHNNGSRFIQKDVNELTGKELLEYYPPGCLKILAGCAPCQPFSSYTQGKEAKEDKRWGLLYAFARLVKALRPEIVTMENVPRLKNHEVYTDFVKSLEGLGYHVTNYVVYCPEYGIPQTRRRLVLFASIFRSIEIIPPTHDKESYVTVKNTIEYLAPIHAGEQSILDPLHFSSTLSDLNLERIRASRPGGTWHDWEEDLRADCHKEESGKRYVSVYGRMEWNKPSPTITAQCYGFGNGRFGHPEQDRAISLREAALLQTFPEDYEFFDPGDPVIKKRVCKLIGNAVPVSLGRVVAKSIKKHLEEVSHADGI